MSVVNSMRRRRKRKNVILEDLDAEKFDIFMIEDVDVKQNFKNRRRKSPTIARTFSEVRRALGKIDENRKEDDEKKKDRMEKECMENKVVSRRKRRKLRNEKKRVLASKAASIRERNRTIEEKKSFNPLNIGPLTLSNEEYTALMRY